MKIHILSAGKLEFLEMFNLYKKKSILEVSLVEFQCSVASRSVRIEEESKIFLEKLKKIQQKYVVLMDIFGAQLSSLEFARFIEKQRDTSVKNLIFIIGGAYGVNTSVKNIANFRFSFGIATWPHNLMKIMLMEQIFRAGEILRGGGYHH